MSRWPAPGRCKRRLAADLGPWRAARIQERLTSHGLTVARGLADVPGLADVERVLAGEGLGPRAMGRWAQQAGLEGGSLQGPGGLGLRLQRQVVRAQRQGINQLVLIGSDLPALETADLQAAFAALRSWPLVLGPALDGGYWLIGLGLGGGPTEGGSGVPAAEGARHRASFRAWAPLFSGIPWGTAAVLQLTLERARQLGLPSSLLACRPDLDERQDLERWLRDPAWGLA